jgi:activating signal cointegrator 1
MKAITLWQPWATLVILGLKRWETRSWSTNHRGDTAIHAAARPVVWSECDPEIIKALDAAGIDRVTLPLGKVLGVVKLTAVYGTREALKRGLISGQERAFGDYSPGRFCWQLGDVRPFIVPVPMRGAQGFWEFGYAGLTNLLPAEVVQGVLL